MSSWHDRVEVIDLSQEIYEAMPVSGSTEDLHHAQPVARTEPKGYGLPTLGFAARNILMSEHGPTLRRGVGVPARRRDHRQDAVASSGATRLSRCQSHPLPR